MIEHEVGYYINWEPITLLTTFHNREVYETDADTDDVLAQIWQDEYGCADIGPDGSPAGALFEVEVT